MGIAEKWEVATDGLSWTFSIRKGVKWHNGDDLTAKDVKFSLDRYAVEDRLYPYLRDSQERVEVVDDYTVRVFTKGTQPFYNIWPSFEQGQQGIIMPKSYIEKVGLDYFKLHPVGSGPFRYVRRVPGDLVEYTAQAQHYRQTPAFKTLSMILIPEETTRIAMLKTRQVDIIEISLQSVPELEATGLRTIRTGGVYPSFYFFGTYDPRAKGMATADIRVRQALFLAIKQDEIASNLFYGKLQPVMPPYIRVNQAEIDLPYWRAEAAKAFRYDPEEAKRLLKEAGYANGFTVKFYAYNDGGATYMLKLAEVIASYWQKIGVKTEVIPVDKGFFQLWRRGGPNRGPANELVGQVGVNAPSGSLPAGRGLSNLYNIGGASHLLAGVGGGSAIPELDALVSATMAEPNAAKRKEMHERAIRMAMDTWTAYTFGMAPGIAALGPRVDLEIPATGESVAAFAEYAKPRQ